MNTFEDYEIDKERMNEEVMSEVILKLPLLGTKKLLSLMEIAFNNLPAKPFDTDIGVAGLHLLSRIYNDIQSIYHLTKKGYSVQAATIACALYEAALTVIYIDGDEVKGRKWLNHNNERTTVEKISELRNSPWVDQTSQELAKVYRYLSMAKHSNPLILSVHSFVQSGDFKNFNYGSENSESSFRLSYYAIHVSLQLGNLALCVFINNIAKYIEDDIFSTIFQLQEEFRIIHGEIIKEATEKYGES
ncbi:hypothetical protein [Paenibacillus illinoisensis]|uniref:hypothetical protein n=1 Tax=Paenibacillus illinoisensis TaxID=59845 RepID=UPI00301B92F2